MSSIDDKRDFSELKCGDSVMNSRAFLIGAAAAAILLSGCAYSGYSAGVDVGYAVPAYYEGFYGPYWDGYWGPDGFFYFYDVDGHRYRRDDHDHFRHNAAPGYRGIARSNIPGGIHPSHAFTGAVHGGAMQQRRG
jgi:hypothetical protein